MTASQIQHSVNAAVLVACVNYSRCLLTWESMGAADVFALVFGVSVYVTLVVSTTQHGKAALGELTNLVGVQEALNRSTNGDRVWAAFLIQVCLDSWLLLFKSDRTPSHNEVALFRYQSIAGLLLWIPVPTYFYASCSAASFLFVASLLRLLSLFSVKDTVMLPFFLAFCAHFVVSVGDTQTLVTVKQNDDDKTLQNQEPHGVDIYAALEDSKRELSLLRESKNDVERLSILRKRYLSHIEHRINNPVQGIVFVIEEITAMISHWTADFEDQNNLNPAEESKESQIPNPAPQLDKQNPSTTITTIARPIIRSRRSEEEREIVSANGKPRALKKNDNESEGSQHSIDSNEILWQQRVAEFNALADMALSAVDGLSVTCSDMHDGLSAEVLPCIQSPRQCEYVRQPTNVHWIFERAEYALQFFSASGKPSTTVCSSNVSCAMEVERGIQTCVTDSGWLFSLVMRFVGNAKRFTSLGSIVASAFILPAAESSLSETSPEQVTFDFTSEKTRKGEFIRIQVVDTGVGVPPNLRSRLFSINNTDPEYHGFGLFLARQKMEVLEGRCGYRPNNENSQTGSGSVFWIDVPYVTTDAEPTSRAPPRIVRTNIQTRRRPRFITAQLLPTFNAPQATPNTQAAATNPTRILPMIDRSAKRILIIEDEEIQRKLLSKQLENLGFEVFQAEDGITGLEMMKERQYRLVLCDKVMPRMHGDECVRTFREWEKEKSGLAAAKPQYICGFSANRESELPEGFDMYLTKPIKRADLFRILMIDEK